MAGQRPPATTPLSDDDTMIVGQGPLKERRTTTVKDVRGPQPPTTQRARLATASDGTITWTFATPFAAGVVPNVTHIAEAPTSGANSNANINVQLIGVPTNTQARVKVNVQTNTLSVVGLSVTAFTATPAGIVVHLSATAP